MSTRARVRPWRLRRPSPWVAAVVVAVLGLLARADVVVALGSGTVTGGSTTGNTVLTSLATLLTGAGSIVCSGTSPLGCESDTCSQARRRSTATETTFSTVPD